MATYPILPPTLSALDATKSDPQGTEAANLIDDCLRQTRTWMYDFLSIYIDPTTNKIRPSAFSSESIPAGLVRGTNPVSKAQREIQQKSIQPEDIADNSITGAQLAIGGIQTANIANDAIITDKIADKAVTLDKMATQTISNNQLVDLTIDSIKIKDAAITHTKLAAGSVLDDNIGLHTIQPNKLETVQEGYMLVGGNGPSNNELAAKQITGAITIDKDGIASFAGLLESGGLGYAWVAEVAPPGGEGAPYASVSGDLPSKTWLKRGGFPGNPWQVVRSSRSMIEVRDSKIMFKEEGNYLIMATAPAHYCSSHKSRMIVCANGSTPATTYIVPGTSEHTYASSVTRSKTQILQFMTAGAGDIRVDMPWIEIEHWVKTNNSTLRSIKRCWGFSTAASGDIGGDTDDAGLNEYYAEITIIKLS